MDSILRRRIQQDFERLTLNFNSQNNTNLYHGEFDGRKKPIFIPEKIWDFIMARVQRIDGPGTSLLESVANFSLVLPVLLLVMPLTALSVGAQKIGLCDYMALPLSDENQSNYVS